MPIVFNSCSPYRYRPDGLYLGKSPVLRRATGYRTERHALTIAGARAGKGAALIIPNLLRWRGSALVVDPKGEAAEATAEYREKMGQRVYVLDPFKSSRVPSRFRRSYNLLANLTPDTPHIMERLRAIADGLVLRDGSDSGHWDDGGLDVVAGLLAQTVTFAEGKDKTLPGMRQLLTLDDENFTGLLHAMQDNEACDRLAITAANRLLQSGREAASFKSVAMRATNWLDSRVMREALSAGDISLSELKAAPTTIYLVLPVDMLDQHGRFLRLFVRTAIDAMAQKLPNGSLKGVPCLFLLDEFAALGRIDEIQKAAGLMPGYGVHLWPILQDYGQLTRLYRNEGAETFFGNSDIITFFGNTDQMTLDKIARMIGEIRRSKNIFAPERQDDIGRPLMTAREIRNHIRKGKGDVVARRMIAFMPGDDILSIRPAPYFKQWGWRDPELEIQAVPA